MSKSLIVRIIVDILIAFCVLQGWWFFALPIAVIAAWFSPYFIEMIVAGIVYDSLYGSIPTQGIWDYVGTIASVAILAMESGLKRAIRK
jgi:hypothetical protein